MGSLKEEHTEIYYSKTCSKLELPTRPTSTQAHKPDHAWQMDSMDYMVCTVAEPQKKLHVFEPGKWSVNADHKIALYGHDAKNMKQFALHFENTAQCDSLDRHWFGEVWFPVEKSEWEVQYAQAPCNLVDPGELNLEPGQDEPELCFSRSQVRDPAYALLDTGATHVLLPGHMLYRGARSFEVTVNLAVGKKKARCWRNEVYAEDRAHPLLPLGRLANLLDNKFLWESGQAFMQCRDKGNWKTMPQFEVHNTLWAQKAQLNIAFDWKFWEKGAQDPKMSTYPHCGVKAKMCETTPFVNTVGTLYIAARAKIELACDSIRAQGQSLNTALGIVVGKMSCIPEENTIAQAVRSDAAEQWSTLIIRTNPFPADILLDIYPHQPASSSMRREVQELNPAVIVECYLDAKYCYYDPVELTDLADLHATFVDLVNEHNIVTVEATVVDEHSASVSIDENIKELDNACLSWEQHTETINPKCLEHHQSGHLVKDKTCPICIEESGSRVAHWRKQGDRQTGVMHLDLAAFEPSANGHM